MSKQWCLLNWLGLSCLGTDGRILNKRLLGSWEPVSKPFSKSWLVEGEGEFFQRGFTVIFEATWLRSWRVMRYKSAKQVSKHYLRQRIIEGFFNNSIALKYFTNTSQYVSVWLCFLALHNFTENHLFQASSPVCSTFPPFSESIKSSRWDIGWSGSKK